MKRLIQILPASFLSAVESFLLNDFKRAKFFVTKSDPDVFEDISRKKMMDIFKHAAKNVPAYRDFLEKNKINADDISSIDLYNTLIPETNKKNYILKYSYDSRCVDGKLPFKGNIDESSGSSGKPTNWIRSVKEENLLFKAAKFEFNYIFDSDNKDYIVLSAWSTGPWATGVKFCTIVEHFCLVKNTDTNIDNIINTLKTFGKKQNYIIAGYPPFIKHLIDEGKKKINWKDYNINIVTGGEGIILSWEDYIVRHLKKGAKIISSYGASDVDIGIGFETPLSMSIRRLCSKNKKLREALFGHHERLPMLFQYNPCLHYITNHINKQGKQEYQISLLDKNVASPKIKYNLNDEGGVLRYKDVVMYLEKFEPKYAKRLKQNKALKDGVDANDVLKLPFLYVVGRSDGTVSFDGANVYPHQIEMCIHSNKKLLDSTKTFRIGAEFDKNKNVNFNIRIELKKGLKASENLRILYHNIILEKLMQINSDFRESYLNDKSIINPQVHLYEHGHSVFNTSGIKNKYIE
ncbi:MAG: hypothetical protein ABIG89_02065 [Candidatus Woesearchaeota archaeon]